MRRLSGAVQWLSICWEWQRESESERWTHNRALPLLYQITVVPSFASLLPLPCVAYPPFSVYVGLIEAFRHRIKASGSVPLRRRLEAACPNAEKKVKQSSSKRPSSRRRGFFRLQHQQRTFRVFHCEKKILYFLTKREKLSSKLTYSVFSTPVVVYAFVPVIAVSRGTVSLGCPSVGPSKSSKHDISTVN